MSEQGIPGGDAPVDWQVTTYEGARREQLRRWSRLSLRQIILALEDMEELSRKLSSPVSSPVKDTV